MRQLLLLLLSLSSSPLLAADHYALVTLGDLVVEGAPLPESINSDWYAHVDHHELPVQIDGGEAWLPTRSSEMGGDGAFYQLRKASLAIVGSALPIRGRLLLPVNKDQMRSVEFSVPANFTREAPDWQWKLTAAMVDRERIAQHRPGEAWFRRHLSTLGIGPRPGADDSYHSPLRDIEHLMDLVNGTIAIRENLALRPASNLPGGQHRIERVARSLTDTAKIFRTDEAELRQLNHLGEGPVAPGTLVLVPERNPWNAKPPAPKAPTASPVAIADLPGITLPTVTWGDLPPIDSTVDPSASIIPEDQHAVFAADLTTLLETVDSLDHVSTPVQSLMEEAATDARIADRYRHQLTLDSSDLTKVLGPTVIERVAITGHDPFLRSGTDLAVIFTPKQRLLLLAALTARHASAIAKDHAIRVQGEIDHIPWTGVVTADRSVCSYVAEIANQVVVTNSLDGLRSLVVTSSRGRANLASTPDYRFFRSRYPLKEGGVLAVLSDATIRRWSSAAWRIADVRRQQANRRLIDLALEHAPWVVEQRGARPAPIEDPQVGKVDFDLGAPRSSLVNTVRFLTPLVEMLPTEATGDEANAYRSWLGNYQANWTRSFDPIAVQVQADASSITMDVTVRPLTRRSQLQELINFTKAGAIVPGSGDPHNGSLIHLGLAVDLRSALARDMGQNLGRFGTQLGLDPLRWIGGWATVSLELDEDWLEATRVARSGSQRWRGLPVLVHIPSKDPLALAGFMAGLHSMADQSAPGLVTWETRTDRNHPYVAILPAQGGGALPAIFYATTHDALILSANERVLQEALVRHDGPASTTPWHGDHVGLRLAAPHRLLSLYRSMQDLGDDPLQRAQRRSWSNLALLSSLAAQFPTTDPTMAWERLQGSSPSCPGGGAYVKDATGFWESSRYGSPWHPRGVDDFPEGLVNIGEIQAGATFEEDGLRARLIVQRTAGKQAASPLTTEDRYLAASRRGDQRRQEHDLPGAIIDYRQALDLAQRQRAFRPDDKELLLHMVQIQFVLTDLSLTLGDLPNAKLSFAQAKTVLTPLLKTSPQKDDLLQTLRELELRIAESPQSRLSVCQTFADEAPASPHALNMLAWELLTSTDLALRDSPRALNLAEAAVKASHRQMDFILDTLAVAYGEAGRWDEAIATEQEAIAKSTSPESLQETLTRLKAHQRLPQPVPEPKP